MADANIPRPGAKHVNQGENVANGALLLYSRGMRLARSPRFPFTRLARHLLIAAAVGLVVAALPSCSSDSGNGSCPIDGDCVSSVRGTVALNMKGTVLQDATIKACTTPKGATQNCATGTFGTVPTGAETVAVVLDGKIPATAYLTKKDTTYTLQVVFSVASQAPADGDEYSIDVVRVDGTSAKNITRVVTYTSVTPNGPGCLPVCKVSEFTE